MHKAYSAIRIQHEMDMCMHMLGTMLWSSA